MSSRGARWATWAVIALHAALLVAMLPDYWADNDLGYHISLARQYAEHGTYLWDRLNYAPAGRPNLQGPLLHYANGGLGRILGARGDDYVLAFSLLAVLQWAAAVFTAVFLARRFGGDWAGLFAAALLTGGIFSAASFFTGVPSGWIFILTAWAIFFFLEDRVILSSLFTAAVVYVHLGGIATAPFGVFLAASLTRRWRSLLKVAGITAVLAAPYVIHFLRSLDYYRGQRGHVAGSANLLIYALAAPGLVWLLRRPRRNAMLLAWVGAPLAWFFQDRLRFFLQSSAAGAVLGAVFLAWLLERPEARWVRLTCSTAFVALAMVWPLSLPSLPIELAWATGHRFPLELNWSEAKVLAEVLREAGLENRILSSYYASLACAVAVYTPIAQVGGHWGEVQPRVDPAEKISAGDLVYLLPLPPGDDVLVQYRIYGLVRIHGGSNQTSVVTLTHPGLLNTVPPLTAEVLNTESRWLARQAVNNSMPPLRILASSEAMEEYRQRMIRQKIHVGRLQLAALVYAYALEPQFPEVAQRVRSAARSFGSLANFVGDETAIGYINEVRFQRLRENLLALAKEAVALRTQAQPPAALVEATDRLFREYF